MRYSELSDGMKLKATIAAMNMGVTPQTILKQWSALDCPMEAGDDWDRLAEHLRQSMVEAIGLRRRPVTGEGSPLAGRALGSGDRRSDHGSTSEPRP